MIRFFGYPLGRNFLRGQNHLKAQNSSITSPSKEQYCHLNIASAMWLFVDIRLSQPVFCWCRCRNLFFPTHVNRVGHRSMMMINLFLGLFRMSSTLLRVPWQLS